MCLPRRANALKRSLQRFAQDVPDTTSHLHSCIEALRNGYSILHAQLSSFVAEHLHFEDSCLEQPHLFALWTCLGLPPATAEELAELQLRWEEGRLAVATHCLESESLFDRITSCVLAVWRFRAFTDSRWCTVGDSCRSLVAALCLGLEPLMQKLFADPDVGQFYIAGSRS